MTSWWAHWRLNSSASQMFTQPFSQGADQRKHQSPASLAFVMGIHRSPVNSPHKGPVTRKMFPFDDVIMLPCALEWCKLFQYARVGRNCWPYSCWSFYRIHKHKSVISILYQNWEGSCASNLYRRTKMTLSWLLMICWLEGKNNRRHAIDLVFAENFAVSSPGCSTNNITFILSVLLVACVHASTCMSVYFNGCFVQFD